MFDIELFGYVILQYDVTIYLRLAMIAFSTDQAAADSDRIPSSTKLKMADDCDYDPPAKRERCLLQLMVLCFYVFFI